MFYDRNHSAIRYKIDYRSLQPDWAIFERFSATGFLTKVAQIFSDFWGYFEKPCFK